MPLPVAAKAGIVVAAITISAAIALYESPEFRQVADNVRRRIALALYSLGENIDPSSNEPLFNRPEDAEGFLHSGGGPETVEADEESRRRQREELMYWNAKREEERRQHEHNPAPQPPSPTRNLTFDDFLREDRSAERGTLVYNTGANPWGTGEQQGMVKRRGGLEGVRGLSPAMIANPFGDEYGIELDEQTSVKERHALSPGRDEILSDIYDATPHDGRSVASQTLSPQSKPMIPEVLFDFDAQSRSNASRATSATVDQEREAAPSVSTRGELTSFERELADDEFMTAGQDDRQGAYETISAWAHGSSPGFYSPLPETPVAPVSEPELISEGTRTPADNASVAGSLVDLGDAVSSHDGDDVLSEDEDGVLTPTSWSDVGSEISESESHP